ncbi:ABC transporter ATP-binding protein [Variovorax ureilyticus]|uniref:ABC transporter ATP-binding protein n=1 Tax=Variovorax ureilyticus TaxID=1836198 RepID=A0ABU8VC74_9BURK
MIHRAGAGLACLLIALSSNVAVAQEAQPQPAQEAPQAPQVQQVQQVQQPQESPAVRFDSKPFWELVIGPFAVHWSNESEHKHVYLLGIEGSLPGAPKWSAADATIWGFSAFNNSFGQASAYAYYGYRWDNLFGYPSLYAKLTGGILYGYKGEYENKVPFNHDGFGLAIIPGIGYRITQFDAVQVNMLGAAGLIFTYNRRF